jgi:hypothetical protein
LPALNSQPSAQVRTRVASVQVRWWAFLLIAWVIGGVYEGAYLKRGWVPHDEGAFAESAERVLHGELPHRDYVEIYTGGLAYLHAWAFRYLGDNFATPRIVLFVFFLAWIPVFYWIASRLAPDWVAAAVTLLAVAWSVPNYSAAVPSWYNLFFATFGLAAVFRYLEVRQVRWLFVAGLCGGFSILAKIVGLYYVAAMLLFFLFMEQSEAAAKTAQARRRSIAYTSFVALSIFAFVAVVCAVIRGRASLEVDMEFVIPAAALAATLLFREQRCVWSSSRERFTVYLRMCIPFALGVLTPSSVFLIPYIRGNALKALASGLFVLPFKRVLGAYVDPPPIATMLPAVLVVSALVLGVWLRGWTRWLLCAVAGAIGAYLLISSAQNMLSYRVPWYSAYWLIPLVAVGGSLLLWQSHRTAQLFTNPGTQEQLFALLAVISLCALVQFPFAAPIYFCYVAPLVILGSLALLRLFPKIPRPLIGVFFAVFFLFAVFRLTPPYVYVMGFYYQANPETQVLDLPRAGNLRVDQQSVNTYRRLMPLIREHAGKEEIYAAPDCPQVYFLAGYSNPTLAPIQMFDKRYSNDQEILDLMASRNIRLVVLNRKPDFSPLVGGDLREALMKRYPSEELVGDFVVRWRD